MWKVKPFKKQSENKCQFFSDLSLKKRKPLNIETLEENLKRFDHIVYMLKIITKIKIHVEDQEDFKKFDNGHTLNILKFI